MRRGLVALLVLWAAAAHAEPDCAESPVRNAVDLVAFEIGALESDKASDLPAETPGTEVTESRRPQLRPCKFRNIALGRERMRNRGAVCKDWTILGETLKQISGPYRGCRIANPRFKDVMVKIITIHFGPNNHPVHLMWDRPIGSIYSFELCT